MNLAKPSHITSLATSGILVSVDVRVWTATRQDKDISKEVTDAKKAEKDAGRFVKHLLANVAEHKAILNYRQEIYNWTQRETYDWAGSQRYLPSARIPKFMEEYSRREVEFNSLIDKFIFVLPAAISNMAFVQGDMFKREDYPDAATIRNKFSINLFTSNVPEGDFRCQVAQELADDLQKHYGREAEKLANGMLDEQLNQLQDVMESISRCCTIENVVEADGTTKIKRKKLYDSTIRRAMEYCDSFKTFNLTGDPRLEGARSALENVLVNTSLEVLRESDGARQHMKNSVDDILKKFGKV
jgi:hypothetical protein